MLSALKNVIIGQTKTTIKEQQMWIHGTDQKKTNRGQGHFLKVMMTQYQMRQKISHKTWCK